MAQNVNIPFDLTINSIKNTNEAFSKVATQLARNVEAGLSDGFAKFNVKGAGFGDLNKQIAGIQGGFESLVTTVVRLQKTFGSTNPLIKTLGDTLPKSAQGGVEAYLHLEKTANSVLARLTSGNERQVQSAQKALKNIFSSDVFNNPQNDAARGKFLAVLNNGLNDYEQAAKTSAKNVLNEQERNAAARIRLEEETSARMADERKKDNDLRLQATLAGAKARQDAEYKANQIQAAKDKKLAAERLRLEQETAARIQQEKKADIKANADTFIGNIEERGRKELEFRRASANAQKQLEKTTEQVIDRQQKLNELLARAKTLGVTVDPKFQKFASANPVVVAGKEISDKRVKADNNQLFRDAARLNKELIEIKNGSLAAGSSIESFGDKAALAFKRYGAFLVGTFAITRIVSIFGQATDAAIQFEAQMTKVEQVTTGTNEELLNISKSISDAAIETGTSIVDIADAVQTFAQAGFTDPKQLAKVAKDLAKIPLAATFGDIKSTSEGLIAIFGQFNKTLDDTGRILNLVNQFSADYAVESKDLFEGVKRGGAVFAAAGGSLEEFISLFSLLRSSTRQSAETIGTFFKSGITQLLNPNSQLFLKQLGVTASGVTQQFGQLAEILFGPNSEFKNNQIINIGQQLTGDRQIGSFLALLREVEQQRQKLSKTGGNDILTTLSKVPGSLDQSIVKRIDDVGVSFNRVKQAFSDLAKKLIENNAFKTLVKDLSNITISLVSATKAIGLFIPALLTLTAASGVPKFTTGFNARLFGTNKNGIETLSALQKQKDGKLLNNLPIQLRESVLNKQSDDIRKASSQLKSESFLNRTGLVAGGLVLGGSLLQSEGVRDNKISSNFTAGNLGSSLSIAGIGVALGSIFGPLTAVLGGLIGGIGAAVIAIKENTKQLQINTTGSPTEQSNQLLSTLFSEQRKQFFETAPIGSFIKPLLSFFSNPSIAVGQLLSTDFSVENKERVKSKNRAARDTGFISQVFNPGLENIRKNLLPDGTTPTNQDTIRSLQNFNKVVDDLLSQSIRETQKEFEKDFKNPSKNNEEFESTATLKFLDKISFFKPTGNKNLDRLIREKLSDLLDIKFLKTEVNSAFNSFTDNLKNLLSNITLGFKDITKNFDNINSQLNSIITNLGDTVKGNNVADKQSLFKQLGFENLSNFIGGNASLSKSLNDFLNQGNNRANLIQEALPFTGGKDKLPAEETGGRASFASVARSIFKDDNIFKEFVKNFQGPLTELADLADITFQDLFKKLAQSTNIDQFVESFQAPIKEVLDFLLETENKRIQVLNRRLEIEKALTDQARQGNESLFNLTNTIQGIRNTSSARGLERDAFNNESGGSVAFLQARASLFARNANRTSFGSTSTFTQELLDAAKKRNTAVGAASERNRQGLRPDEGVLTDSLRAQSDFADKQQELNQRLVELDSRVSAAASATDTLREAFNSLRENVRSAGQAITGLTQKDFGNIATTLKGFVAGGGISNPFGPLSNFSQKQFGFLQQGLGLLGNIDLGGGQTGQKILNKIFDSLGSTALGGLAGIFTGKDETQNVQKQLEKLRADAEKAAQVEEALRQEQIALLTAQAGLIPIEQQFYKDQIKALDSINANLDPLGAIRDSVAQLFTVKAQNVKLISDTSESKNTSNTPIRQDGTSKFPFVLPNNVTPVIIPKKNIDFNPKSPLEPFRDTTRPSEFRVPRSLGPNVIEPRKTPQEVAPSGPLGPDGRPRNNNLPVPGFELPKVNIPKGTAPEIIFGAKEGVEINTGVGNLVEIANNIQKSLEKLSGTQKFTLDVAPLQVNVGLTAPDILALAGTQLQENIMKNIAVKLSEVFRTDPETSSKILSSFATA